MSVLAVIIAFGLLILIHEWGHYIVARLVGIDVERFSIGFGPRLWKKEYKGTEFCLSLIPLGGYVKMLGEGVGEPSDSPNAFSNKSVLSRMAVVSAGVAMNILLACILLPMMYMIGQQMPEYLTKPAIVGEIQSESPAQIAGLVEGDLIVSVDKRQTPDWFALLKEIGLSNGNKLNLLIKRGEGQVSLALKPAWNEEEKRWLVGIKSHFSSTDFVTKRYSFLVALKKGIYDVYEMSYQIFQVVKKLIVREVSFKQLGGPVQIVSSLYKSADVGLAPFVQFVAFLSINLAILNILPIPVLDGGHLFFLTIEGILRRPLSAKVIGISQQVGMALLLFLVIYVTFQDVGRLFSP